jgi:hypothetical protein
VFLGWALAAEPMTARTLVAAAIIVTSVIMITTDASPRPSPRKEPRPASSPAFNLPRADP